MKILQQFGTFGAGGEGEALAYFSKNILLYGTLRSRCTGREFGNMSIGLDLNVCVQLKLWML